MCVQLTRKKVEILHTEAIPDMEFVIINCGKIWRLNKNEPIVICGKRMIRVNSALDEDGIVSFLMPYVNDGNRSSRK